MKKRTMKVLSLVLAIVMAVSLLPLAALAEEFGGTTRPVGVVVYGAELTALLTDMEKSLNDLQDGIADLQDGNVDIEDGANKAKSALERLQILATDIGTKVADGSGISVPDVEVVLIDQNGKEIPLVEDKTIEIFTETTDIYIPFQNDVEDAIKEMQDQLAALNTILDTRIDALDDSLVPGTDALAKSLRAAKGSFASANSSFDSILTSLTTLSTDIVGNLATLTGLNGALYRTYVTEEAVPTGDYTVKVKGFTDTDKDGNAITRDGYILYNDGLEVGGSGFNTYRTFDVTIEEQGMFDHAIQFVGPANGIAGVFELPAALNNVYNTLQTTLNTLTGTLADISGDLLDSSIAEVIANTLRMQDLLDWFKGWNMEKFQLPELDTQYAFTFPGLWCAESDAGFSFTNVDVAEVGLPGSNFLLINRDEAIDVLKLMLDLGKEVFTAVLKGTFGYTDEESGEQYESMLTLYTQLINYEEGQFSIDYDVAYNIIKNYIAIIADMDLLDKVIDTESDIALTPVRLKYPIPAILEATSDENGLVTFNKNSNITLTWMLEIIPVVTEALKNQTLIEGNQVVDFLLKLTDYAADIVAKYGAPMINTLVYPFAQRLGFVGQKFASGKYIMFQIKTDDAYWVNPLAYTMIMTWDNDGWLYVTVADLGIVLPYLTEDFYDFVRNTTFAGTVDSFLSTLTGKDVNLLTSILNDEIDVTKELGQTVTGALTAFIGEVGFDSLGLDSIFANRSEFIAGINQFLYENGRTAQNLMIYVNKQAQRAKSVYAGYVTPDWYFYNLNKSPTATATKLIDKSTQDIATAFVNETASGIVSGIGKGISSVVNTVGTAIESAFTSVATAVKSSIGTAVSSAASKVVSSVKTGLTSLVKNIFKR